MKKKISALNVDLDIMWDKRIGEKINVKGVTLTIVRFAQTPIAVKLASLHMLLTEMENAVNAK